MKMNRCQTCKYWKPIVGEFDELPGIGRCTAVVQYWDAIQWSAGPSRHAAREIKPEYIGSLAFVNDEGFDYAELKTFAEFGCVMHAEHEPEDDSND